MNTTSPQAVSPHPLFEQIAGAASLDEIVSLQLLSIPEVKDFNTRLALREALQARRAVLEAMTVNANAPRMSRTEHNAFPKGRWAGSGCGQS